MLCYCGEDLGEVSAETHGLCTKCGISIWMQAARRLRPDSKAIALEYNRTGQTYCEHDQTACISRCGVERVDNTWIAIPFLRRQQWFAQAFANTAEVRLKDQSRQLSKL